MMTPFGPFVNRKWECSFGVRDISRGTAETNGKEADDPRCEKRLEETITHRTKGLYTVRCNTIQIKLELL